MEGRGLRREADLHVCVATSNSRTECSECAEASIKRKHSPSSFSPKRPRADQLHESKITDVKSAPHATDKLVAGLAEVLGRSSSSNNRESSFSEKHEFFSYRVEHRSSISPSLAMHPGEERILIFASNQVGVVAKIIFLAASSSPVASEFVSRGDETVQARIHVLEVKPSHRGHDLGGLLVVEAMQALRRRFTGRTIQFFLDAEEEDSRYGKLIGFYSRLGFVVRPNAKIQRLNNNDGETYRKIPMMAVSRPVKVSMPDPFAAFHFTLNCKILPVHLQSKDGTDVAFWDHSSSTSASVAEGRNRDPNQQLYWILVDDGNGLFQFRTTCGYHLFASSYGEVRIGQNNNGDPLVFRFSNSTESPDCNVVSDSDESDCDLGPIGHEGSSSSMVPPDETWLMQTTSPGHHHPEQRLFLSTDPCTQSLFLSPRPTPWRVSPKDRSLTCLANQSQSRVQCRNNWRNQNVANVNAWRCKYLSFNLCTMSLKNALDLASSIPLHSSSDNDSSSTTCSRTMNLRSFCFYFAEQFRCSGQPDWLCLVALVHELGRCVRFVEKREKIRGDESKNDDKGDYDWTVACRARVIGCRPSTSVSQASLHDEFRTMCLDEEDPLYCTELGMYEQGCGLSTVLMQWAGPEYMYWMLRHNGAMLPELALQIIRYFSLSGWHRRGEYSNLTNTLDESIRDIVSDFDEERRIARRECVRNVSELALSDCDRLWQSYYFPIAAKYGCESDLSW